MENNNNNNNDMEIVNVQIPDKEKCPCVKCIYGFMGPLKYCCARYKFKPNSVLYENKNCLFFKSKETTGKETTDNVTN